MANGGATDSPLSDSSIEYLRNAPKELQEWAQERLNSAGVSDATVEEQRETAESQGEPAESSPVWGSRRNEPDSESSSEPDGEPAVSPVPNRAPGPAEPAARAQPESGPETVDSVAAQAVDAGILEENDLALAELDEVGDDEKFAVRRARRKARRASAGGAGAHMNDAGGAPNPDVSASADPPTSSTRREDEPEPTPQPATAQAQPATTARLAAEPKKKNRFFPIFVVAALSLGLAFGVYMIGADNEDPAASGQLPEGHPDISQMEGAAGTTAQNEDYAERIFELESAITQNPDDWEARLELGVLLMNRGDYAEAESQWRTVLEGENGHAEAYYNLGFLYVAMSPPDYDKAIEAWDNLFAIDPDSELSRDARSFYDAIKAGPPESGSSNDDGASGGSGSNPGSDPSQPDG